MHWPCRYLRHLGLKIACQLFLDLGLGVSDLAPRGTRGSPVPMSQNGSRSRRASGASRPLRHRVVDADGARSDAAAPADFPRSGTPKSRHIAKTLLYQAVPLLSLRGPHQGVTGYVSRCCIHGTVFYQADRTLDSVFYCFRC